ncbi:hypothetical protein SSYRP_v1c00550 [Spiroplasma syrphidicola EA-1]|uniref:Uncharacterized protein n=1 Tax=Spiroplasma syrphidicola EA-1 TaxID=1276229 RepID=R4UK59_9MOLU|nr:hypothetical protein [Spiroplasma syrphidicola]AGM25651.1 hypothetical protein SSYRP_v1c00550 [Spiroplasma syrphidicola EA-1]
MLGHLIDVGTALKNTKDIIYARIQAKGENINIQKDYRNDNLFY